MLLQFSNDHDKDWNVQLAIMISGDDKGAIIERLERILADTKKNYKPSQGTAICSNSVTSIITPFWIDSACGYKEPILLKKELVFILESDEFTPWVDRDKVAIKAKKAGFQLFLFNGSVYDLDENFTGLTIKNLY